MSKRQIGWGLLLAGLPFAPFLFRPHLDLWHSHALLAQAGILTLFGLSLGAKMRLPENKALSAWVIWIALSSLYTWAAAIIKVHTYPLPMLQGVLHCVVLLMAYIAAVSSWDIDAIEKYMRWIAYSGAVVLAYCCLQLLNLDQFFSDLSGGKSVNMVGTIGNPSHLGTHLALLFPVFWFQRERVWKFVAALCVALILAAYSAGALVALLAGAAFMLYLHRPKWIWAISASLGVVLIGLIVFAPAFSSFNGRLGPWEEFYQFFRQKPVTGLGTGFVMEYSRINQVDILRGWRHVHNEYFQLAIEQGLVGLSIIAWMLHDVFRKALLLRHNRLVVTLAGMLAIFCVNSLVSYPAHLWLTGSLGLLAYCGIHVLFEEEFC